jgi:hypothetical protein
MYANGERRKLAIGFAWGQTPHFGKWPDLWALPTTNEFLCISLTTTDLCTWISYTSEKFKKSIHNDLVRLVGACMVEGV